LLVALFPTAVGAVGIVRPDSLTAAPRHLMDTPGVVYVTGPIRIAMAADVILFAPKSRIPRILRVIGVIIALQGIIPLFIEQERGRAILEQEVELGANALRLVAAVGADLRHIHRLCGYPSPRDGSFMSQSPRPYRSPIAWPAFILCTASLSFSLWVAIYQTPPQGFLARYGLVLLGLGMVAGTAGTLIGGRVQKWLLVLVYICLAASLVGVYLRSH
jgi:hypothetical protein